jgi:ribosomal protein L44E
MFLLFGFKTVFRILGSRPGTCQYCHQYAQHRVEERATKFTLFFIPLLTIRRSYSLRCGNCGQTTALSREQKNAILV